MIGVSQAKDNKIDIIFTPRVFPTPMRESKVTEEDEWVNKNRFVCFFLMYSPMLLMFLCLFIIVYLIVV